MNPRSRVVHMPSNLNSWDLIINRKLNMESGMAYNDIKRKIYTCMDASSSDIPLQKFYGNDGAIFNLEFSDDGRLVIAACEKRSVLLFDSGNQQQIQFVQEAHSSCVNNIKFLDEYTFATCSDDTLIKIWDLRKLTMASRILLGHSNWVKDIDYINDGKLLISSALDGNMYVWDLQDYSQANVNHESLLLLHGITRCRLTPDRRKMIIGTSGGYFIIIHDLDVLRLCSELRSFRPNVYRLMQTSGQTYPCGTMFSHLFNQKRTHNRIEFVDDFPKTAELITSLQIHPMGWCSLTRTIDITETKEWTAVHDIQTRDPREYADAYKYVEDVIDPAEETDNSLMRPTDMWIGFMTHQDASYYSTLRVSFPMENSNSSMGIVNSGLIGFNTYYRQFRHRPEDRNRIVMTIPRLTHTISEKMVAKGFIKEMCFSNDGRVICSPYEKGIRLLAFNDNMDELCYCVPEVRQRLRPIVEMNGYHSNYVLSSKFNPVHYQLVTGCWNGEIVWYKPFL